ncbi:uncharacterized protein LOC121733499 isoform X2 [Aricia agestis]|nr:uncharacterized protein LOC121733499 isoform X2 [Aricia agestis]
MSSGGALGAAALVWLNPGVRALLPPAAAAATPLLLPALASVALALALLLVVARHTPNVLYSYAVLSFSVACGAAGAGGWLALVLARAALDNKWRVAASGARVIASTLTGGLIGPGHTATTYVAYSLNIIVGAAWAALTGLAQVAAAALAAVAARRAARKVDVPQSI